MARLPPKPRDQLDPEQQSLYDDFRKLADNAFGPNGSKFIYEEPNGAFIGPFPLFLYQPSAGRAQMDWISALSKLGLPGDAQETAILTVGGHFQAGFETYSHQRLGLLAGLSQQQTDILKKGVEKPSDLTHNCSLAYDVAKYLISKPGPLPRELWEKSVEAFGKDATVGLLQYVGYYCYVCVILNGMDAPVPE